nr:hypothetical protein [Tanacetum cinerariifolium]
MELTALLDLFCSFSPLKIDFYGLGYGVLGFLGVGTMLDIFHNIILLYFQYGVLVFTGYGVLSLFPLWSLAFTLTQQAHKACLSAKKHKEIKPRAIESSINSLGKARESYFGAAAGEALLTIVYCLINDDDDDEEEELAKDDEKDKETGKGGDEVRKSEGESEGESEEEEGSFDPIPRTPEDSEKESDDEEEKESRLSEEARIQEEEDADELYRDVNINQGRGLQVTQNVEDTHVILTPVNSDGPQESSS